MAQEEKKNSGSQLKGCIGMGSYLVGCVVGAAAVVFTLNLIVQGGDSQDVNSIRVAVAIAIVGFGISALTGTLQEEIKRIKENNKR